MNAFVQLGAEQGKRRLEVCVSLLSLGSVLKRLVYWVVVVGVMGEVEIGLVGELWLRTLIC